MPLPVISVAQMREWEKATWASGQAEENVIRQAGTAIARRTEQLTRPGDFILVLCGKGHNGDDARVAAEVIRDREVKTLRVTDPEAVAEKLADLLARKPALLIDGLFGIGLNRGLRLDWIKLIQQINDAQRPVLAVDVPSGLNADTGFPLDEAVRATYTVTLGAAKQGLLSPPAWPFVGRLEAAPEIGLIPYPFTTEMRMILAEDFVHFPPRRPLDGHKGTFGHLAIIAGSFGYHGAAVLAARGAQRAQPGLITVITEERVYHPVAEQLQSAMVHTVGPKLELPINCTAVVIGPGLASNELPPVIPEMTRRLWSESPLAVIVDASALEWLPEGPCPENAIRLITPHPGEAARMLGTTPGEILANRGPSVRALSKRWGNCFVILKGHQTMIGRSREDLYVNCSGNPHLAQGGSGDLLAGYVGGLLAQPALQKNPGKAIQYAVWQHGAAADLLTARRANWTVEDLPDVLGSVTVI
jgi:ADP-dependent NAD(P)H-hydrate dehydratase / NAD(P)H-hydrate epimerase